MIKTWQNLKSTLQKLASPQRLSTTNPSVWCYRTGGPIASEAQWVWPDCRGPQENLWGGWKESVFSCEFVFFFFFPALLHALWEPSYLVKDWTQGPSSESSECQPLNCQEIPQIVYILIVVGGYTALYICKCIHSNSWKYTAKVSKFYYMQLNLNNIV